MKKLIRYEPIEEFPRARTLSPKQSTFRAPWNETENKLIEEAARAAGENLRSFYPTTEVVIALDADRSDFRKDGAGLMANVRLRSDAVVVYINDEGLSFPCDAFTKWRDNVRAVALTMEKLRTIERYGVADAGQQYTGWKALPTATEMPVASDPIAVLVDVLGWKRELVLADVKAAIAKARLSTHPDTGLLKDRWPEVQAAAEALL